MAHEGHGHDHGHDHGAHDAASAPLVVKEHLRMEFTPNPMTLKFSTNKPFLDRGVANFTERAAAEASPLARRVFAVPGVVGVMVGPAFLTVTRASSADPSGVYHGVHGALHEFYDAKESAVDAKALETTASALEGTARRIKEIIEEEVRPAVAMDGGDISFERFHEGVVYVWMKGSCSSCPSSTATLKGGIEARLKEELPEVQEVVQI